MKDDELTQVLQNRLRFGKRTYPANAAVLIAITQEADPKILLTRRSAYLSNHAGEVSFPGGKRDPNDTSNIVVALREAWEETALNPFDVKLIGDLHMERAKSGLTVKPVVGLIPPDIQLIAQPSDIDQIIKTPTKQILESQTIPYEVRLAHQSVYFPSLRIENEIIWGLTARILISLFKYGLDYQKNWPFLLNSPSFKSQIFNKK